MLFVQDRAQKIRVNARGALKGTALHDTSTAADAAAFAPAGDTGDNKPRRISFAAPAHGNSADRNDADENHESIARAVVTGPPKRAGNQGAAEAGGSATKNARMMRKGPSRGRDRHIVPGGSTALDASALLAEKQAGLGADGDVEPCDHSLDKQQQAEDSDEGDLLLTTQSPNSGEHSAGGMNSLRHSPSGVQHRL